MARVYLALSIAGTVIPYAFFLPWMLENGINVPLLFAEIFSTRVGAFFGSDVIIAAVALLAFIITDGRKHNVRTLWLPIAGTLLVGVSAGLPLYLLLRERKLVTS